MKSRDSSSGLRWNNEYSRAVRRAMSWHCGLRITGGSKTQRQAAAQFPLTEMAAPSSPQSRLQHRSSTGRVTAGPEHRLASRRRERPAVRAHRAPHCRAVGRGRSCARARLHTARVRVGARLPPLPAEGGRSSQTARRVRPASGGRALATRAASSPAGFRCAPPPPSLPRRIPGQSVRVRLCPPPSLRAVQSVGFRPLSSDSCPSRKRAPRAGARTCAAPRAHGRARTRAGIVWMGGETSDRGWVEP